MLTEEQLQRQCLFSFVNEKLGAEFPAGERNSTFPSWDSFRKGKTSQLFLAVPPSGTPQPGVTQSWALTVSGVG